MAPNEAALPHAVTGTAQAVWRGALWTLVYYALLLAVLVYWQGSGLFLYEGF
jgi:hypothetical protein